METSESTPIKDEFLLQCIANYKPLYDKADKGYKSILQKENCWSAVARSMMCTVPEVKTRFKSLREKYRREVAIEEKLQRSGAPYSARAAWPLMSFFKFMYRCGQEKERPTTSNFDNQEASLDLPNITNTEADSDETEEIIIEYHDNPERTILEPNVIESTPSTSQATPIQKKRKLPTGSANQQVSRDIDNVLVDVSGAIKSLGQSKKNSKYDLFAQYLAAELQDMEESNAEILMEELQLQIINFKRLRR